MIVCGVEGGLFHRGESIEMELPSCFWGCEGSLWKLGMGWLCLGEMSKNWCNECVTNLVSAWGNTWRWVLDTWCVL